MIVDHEWHKPEVKQYFHQTKLSSAHISSDCTEESVEYMESINTEKKDSIIC